MKKETTIKTERTSAGLTNALFDEIDNLINGKSDPTMARAKAALAKTIIDVKTLEMSFAKNGNPNNAKLTKSIKMVSQ